VSEIRNLDPILGPLIGTERALAFRLIPAAIMAAILVISTD